MHTTFFESSRFNTTHVRPYYVNRDCFGDDVAYAIRDALRSRGVPVDDHLCGEDWGWELEFGPREIRHVLGIGCRPATDVDPYTGEPIPAKERLARPEWCGVVSRRRSFGSCLMGKPPPTVLPEMLGPLHEILVVMEGVENLRWLEPDGDPGRAADHPTR